MRNQGRGGVEQRWGSPMLGVVRRNGRRHETRGNSERGGHAGASIMPAFETSSRMLSMPRLSLNLLKCLYSHCICLPKAGITLFINQKGYVHLEPPVIICTVVVVDLAAR
jgi:hypothetical protein